MIGHECMLSRTNAGGFVWMCECGEIGDVVPMIDSSEEITQRSQRRIELTASIARARHGKHLDEVRADIVRRSNDHLDQLGQAINSSNAVLQRRGRFGHP